MCVFCRILRMKQRDQSPKMQEYSLHVCEYAENYGWLLIGWDTQVIVAIKPDTVVLKFDLLDIVYCIWYVNSLLILLISDHQ